MTFLFSVVILTMPTYIIKKMVQQVIQGCMLNFIWKTIVINYLSHTIIGYGVHMDKDKEKVML